MGSTDWEQRARVEVNRAVRIQPQLEQVRKRRTLSPQQQLHAISNRFVLYMSHNKYRCGLSRAPVQAEAPSYNGVHIHNPIDLLEQT